MSFFKAVVRLILKNTSLLLSVTLMFKCSDGAFPSGFSCAPGLAFPSEPDMFSGCEGSFECVLEDKAIACQLCIRGESVDDSLYLHF